MNRTSKSIPTMKTGAKLMLTERSEIPANITPEESRAFALVDRPVFPVATRNIPQADLARYADITQLAMPPPRLRPQRPSTSNAPFQPINRPQISIDLTVDDILDLMEGAERDAEQKGKQDELDELYRFLDD